MRLLVLHLSDIHFEKKKDVLVENIEGITNTFNRVGKVEGALIIISGDIAFSGKFQQYNAAWELFKNIKNKLVNQYGVKKVDFAIVPGNHDINYDVGEWSREDMANIHHLGEEDLHLSDEINKMSNFYRHANGLHCFKERKELVYIKEIQYGNYSVKINLINTAVYSLRQDEDQGFHYLPESELKKIGGNEEVDYVFTVMHHPHHWYSEKMKKALERKIYQNSDIIFMGHEHYSSSLDIGTEYSQVKVYAGGELANKGDWTNSEFYLGILDTENRSYSVDKYIWNSKAKIYNKNYVENIILNKNRENKYDLAPQKDYYEDMFRDHKYAISEDISSYYVFPRMEEQVIDEKRPANEIIDIDSFISEVFDKKKIIVLGRSGSGKTVLLKQLYKRVNTQKCILFVRPEHFASSNYDSVIKRAFEEIYGANSVEYEKFRQVPKKDKVIIIDEADEIDDSRLDLFLTKAEDEFEIIIYSCGKNVQLDIRERIKRGALEKNYTCYSIKAFYKDKRRELVSNVVKNIIVNNTVAQKNITNILCEALSLQKNLFRMDPDFIVQFTKYYCNNIGETIQNDGEIFSKVFEANIVSLIKPHAKNMHVDKILIVLDKIAYEMHISKHYPMDQAEIYKVIDNYNEEYDSNLDYVEFLNILLTSRMFITNNTKYYFREKNYLAYFVAREIKRKCTEEQDFTEFNKALEFACYDINSDIILFVTYITDNINMIRKLMETAENFTEEWEEFEVNPIKIPYLSDMEQLKVQKVTDKEVKQSEQADIEREREKEREKGNAFEYLDVYNYEEKELNLMNKMVRSLSLLIILARTLPSFEHIMKKYDKEKCVNLIYSLPLRIFNVWALEVEKNKKPLIDEIKAFNEWDYRKDKGEVTDQDVLYYLRWESLSLLLEIMNASIVNATRNNTYRYIDGFDYKKKITYRIEHLMSLDKRDNVNDFIKEAEGIYTEQKQQLPKLMVQRVAKHYIISSKKIKSNNIQKLNAKLWEGKLNQTDILIKKNRNKKREQ